MNVAVQIANVVQTNGSIYSDVSVWYNYYV